MSTLRVEGIKNAAAASDAITLATDGTCTAKITNNLSHRNKVINGAMAISQRGTSFTATGSEYTMDRFMHTHSGGLSFDTTTTHDSSAPVGFRKCLKITPDSTQTPSGSMNGAIETKIEGQDLQDLAFGTSSAKKITISFYAKSAAQNNNHQYTLQIRKYDDSNDRNMLNRAFTVTSSWQRFTMTFDGDTAENIRNDNATGMQILFHLCTGPDDIHAQVNTFSRTTNSSMYTAVTGQSNFMDNTNNEFYLTGIQLEVGDVATDFEYRSYGEELLKCQRYYEVVRMSTGTAMFHAAGNSTIGFSSHWWYKADKRIGTPVLALANSATFKDDSNTTRTLTGMFTSPDHVMFYNANSNGGSFRLFNSNQTISMTSDAEL